MFVLAYFLDPFLFGIVGYIMLYQQYLSYSNLGINYALNSKLAILAINNDYEKANIINSSFFLTLCISIFLFLGALFLYINEVELFPYNNSYNYSFIIVLLTILSHFQQLFINILRIENKLKQIIWSEMIITIVNITVIFCFTGEELVNAIFYFWVIALFCSLIFLYKFYGKNIKFSVSEFKSLFFTGLPLFVFNFSYYLPGLILRSFIGYFYPTVIMGYFSFANNITTAIMLGIDTITWILFPAIISKLADNSLSKSELSNYLVFLTKKIVFFIVLMVFISILGIPILFLLLPKYKLIETSLIILLLNQVIINSAFAFTSLCIARKMYFQLSIISLLTVFFNIVSIFSISYLKLHYDFLVFSNFIAALCFVNLLILFVSRKFELKYSFLIKSFSWKLQILFLLNVILGLVFNPYITLISFVMIIIFKFKFFNEFTTNIKQLNI